MKLKVSQSLSIMAQHQSTLLKVCIKQTRCKSFSHCFFCFLASCDAHSRLVLQFLFLHLLFIPRLLSCSCFFSLANTKGSACVYSKKVEYLFSLIAQTIEVVVKKRHSLSCFSFLLIQSSFPFAAHASFTQETKGSRR